MQKRRTATGTEVDLVVDQGGELVPVEIKGSATPRPEMASGVVRFGADLGPRASRGFVIHSGSARLPLALDVVALPFAEL